MSELEQKVQKSLERLKAFQPKDEPYYLAFSGGKDSVVCKALMEQSGVPYEAVYRVTSVDPPELVRFIKDQHPDVTREVPRYSSGKPITMWNLIPRKLTPPTRMIRYCCQFLKEGGGDGRKMVTGVRWAESTNRRANQGFVTIMKKNKGIIDDLSENRDFSLTNRGGVVLTNDNADSRRVVENCYKRTKVSINPIIDWSDNDVWEFIKTNKIPYCSLYDEGFERLGCIGCPMARTKGREREFKRWPKYKDLYIRTFDQMLRERARKNKLWNNNPNATARDVFNWWMQYDVLPGQYDWFEDYEDDDGP